MSALVRAGFERKFVVPEARARELLTALERLLAPDPFAGPDGGYQVLSLYLDTPDLAAYRREAGGKWRIRRYGDAETLFAEWKEKPEPGQVIKRRTEFGRAGLETLLDPDRGPAPWFARLARERRLAPTRLVGYERHALIGEEGLRVTLDREVVGQRTHCLALPERLPGGAPLVEGRLLEVKFAQAMPTAIERLVADLGLVPESFSKYRRAIERA